MRLCLLQELLLPPEALHHQPQFLEPIGRVSQFAFSLIDLPPFHHFLWLLQVIRSCHKYA
jgi:hypothetical protein